MRSEPVARAEKFDGAGGNPREVSSISMTDEKLDQFPQLVRLEYRHLWARDLYQYPEEGFEKMVGDMESCTEADLL